MTATTGQYADASNSVAGWRRYSWLAGVAFVAALLIETAISATIPVNQNDSAAKIARELDAHRGVMIAVACISMGYAVAFLIYLWRLHQALWQREDTDTRLSTLVLVGGVLFITLHAVSDVGITGMMGGKIAAYSAHNDQGLSYALYQTTFAIDSVGDVLGSVFVAAAGLLLLRTAVLPRWLGWAGLATAAMFFGQGFGLGGVIADFGLILDLIGFVLLIAFVAVSSIVAMQRRV